MPVMRCEAPPVEAGRYNVSLEVRDPALAAQCMMGQDLSNLSRARFYVSVPNPSISYGIY